MKSKLGRIGDPSSGRYPLPLLGIIRGGGCDGFMFLSLILAVSMACRSYLSQRFAVFAGVPGDGRGCLKGDTLLEDGAASFGARTVMVEVAIPQLYCILDLTTSVREESSEAYECEETLTKAWVSHTIYTCTSPVYRGLSGETRGLSA